MDCGQCLFAVGVHVALTDRLPCAVSEQRLSGKHGCPLQIRFQVE